LDVQSDSGLLYRVAVVLEPKSAAPRTSAAKKSAHASSVAINTLKSHQQPVFLALLTITFLAQFYAADLKGIWNDEAVRLTIANGGLATAPFETRQPGQFADVLKAIENFATQPAYLLLVNGILRITHSYSVIPIVTANLLMFLFSAVGIYLLARSLLSPWGVLVSVLLYLWNGFAMVHVLQTREYSLILCLLVWNMAFFYWLFKVGRVGGRRIFWWISLAHFLTTLAAVYATNWAPFFLWPQAVIALLLLRRKRSAALTVCANLGLAGLAWLPWFLKTPKTSALFIIWDRRPPSLSLLLTQFHAGTEHLLVGSKQACLSLLTVYYWMLLIVLVGGVIYFAFGFLRQRFEIQHLVLTTLGFLAFQIAYFFLREPLSTAARYFILYLPFIALLIPLVLSPLVSWVAPSVARRAWLQIGVLLLFAAAGLAQVRNNYRDPYVDHGPDFRVVYRYLISRVAPRDKIMVGLRTNLMALNYYWPSPHQIQLGYGAAPQDHTTTHPRIWTVSYYDEESPSYRRYADYLQTMGYKLAVRRVISSVTIRCFQANPRASEIQQDEQDENGDAGPESDLQHR